MGKVLSKIAVCAALSAAASASSENVRALEDQIAHFKEIRQFWNDKIGNSEQKLAAERAILGTACERKKHVDGNFGAADDCASGTTCKLGWTKPKSDGTGCKCPAGYVQNRGGWCTCPMADGTGATALVGGKYAQCGTTPFELNSNPACAVPATLYAVLQNEGYPIRASRDYASAATFAKDGLPVTTLSLTALAAQGLKVCIFPDGQALHVVPN